MVLFQQLCNIQPPRRPSRVALFFFLTTRYQNISPCLYRNLNGQKGTRIKIFKFDVDDGSRHYSSEIGRTNPSMTLSFFFLTGSHACRQTKKKINGKIPQYEQRKIFFKKCIDSKFQHPFRENDCLLLLPVLYTINVYSKKEDYILHISAFPPRPLDRLKSQNGSPNGSYFLLFFY